MRSWLAIGVLVAAAVAACKKKGESFDEKGPAAGSSAPAIVHADMFLARIRDVLGGRVTGFVVHKIQLRYVRSDGVPDPVHGRLIAELIGPPPPPPPDDPARPIGAPVPARNPAFDRPCVELASSRGGGIVENRPTICLQTRPGQTRIQCTVLGLWAKAIADGAPRDALASLELESSFDDRVWWTFSISDPPRGISFDRRYADDECTPVVEAP